MSKKNNVKHQFHLNWSVVPGTVQLSATTESMPGPVGVVWFRFILDNTRLEILNSFVVETCRRYGYRTEMNSYLFATYPGIKAIVTQHGTRFGLKWMKAVGYQRRDGYWTVTRKDWERRFGKWEA